MSDPRPLRIFVAENHADTLHWLTMYLEDCGHTVGTARTFAEALATVPKGDWDVLISDIGLPDGNGLELLEKLGSAKFLYAIAMSGFGRRADLECSLKAGYHCHLLKPFKMEELDRALEEAAARKS